MIRLRTGGLALAVVLTSMLAACSSANHSGAGTGTSTPSGTVSGAASKGLLLNAPVAFYAVSNGAAGATAIGSTTTSSTDGTFSSTVSSSGPVVVTVSVGSSTQMLDEISGTAIAAPSALVLHAVFDSLTNLQPIAVTPLTEMAYQTALAASGGLTTTNIDAANNAVSTLFLGGAPALYTQPIALSNYASATVAEQAQAKLLTALDVAASSGTAVGSGGSACTGSYSQELVCLVGGLSDLITVDSSGAASATANAGYIAAAYASLDADSVTINGGQSPSKLGLDSATTAETSFVTAYDTQNPLPGFASSGDPLTDTKDLVANIRTNIIDQTATQTFGYAPTLTALNNDVEQTVDPVVLGTSSLVGTAYLAAELLQGVSSGQDGTPTYQGHCGYDPTNLGTGPNTVVCRYGHDQNQGELTLTQTAAGTYTVQTQPLAYSASCSGGNLVISCPFAPVSGLAPLQAQFTLTSSDTGAQSAGLSGPYYVTASGGQVTASLNAAESADWNDTTGSGTITLGGTLSGGSGGVTLQSATIGTDTALTVQNLFSGTTSLTSLLAAKGSETMISGTVDLQQLTTAAFSYAAKVSLGTPVYDASGTVAVPQTVSVTGSVDQVGASGNSPLFTGILSVAVQGASSFNVTEPISATNFFTTQAQVAGTLALSGDRVLTVTAAASATQITPTPTQPDSVSVTYSYSTPSGTAQLNASGQYDATNGYSGTIINNAGVTIAITKPVSGALTGTITASGTETATINGDFVYYSDGTSQSLF